MKLSTKIRYGTRAMLELAVQYGKGPIELKEISKRENISLKYLEQLITPLRSAGLVKSVRGSKGGYSLAKSPSEIRLGDLVEILDGPIHLTECLSDPEGCPRSPFCVTREIWEDVSNSVSQILHSMTLEEMVNRRKEKEGLISPTYQI